jgi:hypothetical protein
MPICEVLFEIADPVGARSALINLFEGNQYKVKENTLRKIVAYHQLSLKNFGHKVEVEFDPATTQCILTTVTLRIDHSESLEYMKSVTNKLAKILPTMKITSVKPKMSLGFKEAAKVAEPETVHCEEIEQNPRSWRCQYCGFGNALGLDRCKHCGRLRRSVIEPEELQEETPTPEAIPEENNDSSEEHPDLE